MRITPTLYGERHDPRSKASIQHIGEADCKISRVAAGLARNILGNVFQMYQSGMVQHFIEPIMTR